MLAAALLGLALAGCERGRDAPAAPAAPGPGQKSDGAAGPAPPGASNANAPSGGRATPATTARVAAAARTAAATPLNMPAGPVDLAAGPIATFAAHCTRCHGPHGSLYPPAFFKMNEAELAQLIDEMMRGPAQLTPAPADVAAMTAHHRALQQKRPFVIVTNAAAFAAGKEGELRGEVTPGATLTARAGERELSVVIDGHTFRIADVPRGEVVLIARMSDAESRVRFPAEQWPR